MGEWSLDKVLDAIAEHAEKLVHPLGDEFFYFVCLILLGVIIYAIYKREWIKGYFLTDERRAHDKELFKKHNDIMSENDVRDMEHCLTSYAIYYSHHSKKTRQIEYLQETVESAYLNKKLQASFQEFTKNLGVLDLFLSINFFPFADDMYRMHPRTKERYELGDEDAEIKWNAWTKELNEKSKAALDSYVKYRTEVKKQLSI